MRGRERERERDSEKVRERESESEKKIDLSHPTLIFLVFTSPVPIISRALESWKGTDLRNNKKREI